MRILQVLLSPRIGGAESLVATLDQSWALAGHVTRVGYLDVAEGDQPGKQMRRVRGLRRLGREFAPDLVVAHSFLPNLYARLALGRRVPVHTVLHSATDDFVRPKARWAERALLGRTASVIAVAGRQLEEYQGHFGRAVPQTVIPNGVGANIAPRLQLRPEARRVVTLARVAEQKRPEFWVKAARLAADTVPEVAFEWWGPGDGDVFGDLPSNARFCGPTTDPASVLESADVLFHPAAREAHSVVLLEGAVAGMPVIYADSIGRPGGQSEWDNRYSAESPESAVETLRHVAASWTEISRSARDFSKEASELYSSRRVAQAYLDWMLGTPTRREAGGLPR